MDKVSAAQDQDALLPERREFVAELELERGRLVFIGYFGFTNGGTSAGTLVTYLYCDEILFEIVNHFRIWIRNRIHLLTADSKWIVKVQQNVLVFAPGQIEGRL